MPIDITESLRMAQAAAPLPPQSGIRTCTFAYNLIGPLLTTVIDYMTRAGLSDEIITEALQLKRRIARRDPRLSVPASCEVLMRTVTRRRPSLVIRVPLESGRCRWCQCTDHDACPGGCAWVDSAHTLCSECVELDRAMRSQTGRVTVARAWQGEPR